MWLMSEAKGVERSVEGLARRLLLVNFAAIHTTSQASENAGFSPPDNLVLTIACPQTITHALYRLLSNPEYIEPLRQEVEAVVAEEGWTKAAMDKMHKIDSFLRESQRLDGITLRTLDSFPSSLSTNC